MLAWILEFILFILTLVVGYIIWWLLVLDRAQTPGKQIVGIWVIGDDGSRVGFGRMFLREFVIEAILFGIASAMTLGIVGLLDMLWPLWDKDNQALHDKVASTVVVQRPKRTG